MSKQIAHNSSVWPGLISRYADHLPVNENTPIVTLLEGNTPLIRADRLAREIGGDIDLYLKYEGLNPTASFKDRGMTMAVSKAKERGAEVVVCASTGNTSASAAAYAARAGLKCVVLLPNGKIALGKLAQALMYGATTISVEGNFDDALRIVRELGETGQVEVVNSVNPVRIEGQKTASFEVVDQLGQAPDFHFLPVGNAGNITAYWKGYKEYFDLGISSSKPRMFGFQAANSAPIVDGFPINDPQTVASAIRIGNPASWAGANNAVEESNGHIGKVTDQEILFAYKQLAQTEGIFAEPACAAPLAGLKECLISGKIPEGSKIVVTLTGHGLKDPDNAINESGFSPTVVAPDLDAVKGIIGL